MKLHSGLLLTGVLLVAGGLVGQAEEPIVAGLVAGGTSAVSYIITLRRRKSKKDAAMGSNLSPTEARLSLVESQLDDALTEIQRLRAAQQFDYELLATRQEQRPPGVQ